MPRWLKITLKSVGSLLILLAIIWIAAAYYLNKNNEVVLGKILDQVNAKVSGTVKVSHMETTLLKGFPGVSVSLKNVELKDSLWVKHKHTLVSAKSIDVSLNALSLIVGTINIRKVAVNNASIYLYTDTNGYSNTKMFATKNKLKKEENPDNSSSLQIRLIDLNNVDLVVDNQQRFKLFSFLINKVNGKIKYPLGKWEGKFSVNTKVRSFAFNTRKGSFLKDKVIAGNMTANYESVSEVIIIDQKPIKIGDDTFSIGSSINIGKNNPAFSIALRADQVKYENIAKILAPNITSKLLRFGIEKPIDITGSIIDNGDKANKDPLINVKMTVKNNNLTIPSGELNNCSFVGFFSNQDTTSKPISDANSIIRFFNLTANYYQAPIKIDTFSVSNLEKPMAKGLVRAKFPLEKLNGSAELETFKFGKGDVDLKLFCYADIDSFLFTKPTIYGDIKINDADITYLPRNLKLINSSLNLNFNQKDLSIKDSRFQIGKSIVNMDCSIENFLNFYYTDPEKIEATVNLSSPQLYIGEFLTFLSPRTPQRRPATSTKNALKQASQQLSVVLETSKVNLSVAVKKAVYDKFIAHNLNANISLIGNGIHFNKVGLQHANGTVNLNGKIEQNGTVNKLNFNAYVNRVNIKEFFYAFNNFGQNTITHQNLKGIISTNVNAMGTVSAKGNILPKSMYGKVNFTLDKAALVGFEPIEKVGKFIFRSRNLSNVQIEKLTGNLTLRGEMVDISPMQINSTALNFDVKGVYGFNKGTNIALDIPLRDPKKSLGIIDKEERDLARMRGIVLRLKAVDENGEIKVKWNGKKDREK
jgi:hypothetical protein